MMPPSSGLKCIREELRNRLDYVGWMRGRWSVRPGEMERRGSPVWANRNSREENGPFQGYSILVLYSVLLPIEYLQSTLDITYIHTYYNFQLT
jgi:hypothetical protein